MAEEKRVIYFYEKDAEKYEEERFISERGKYEDITQKDIVFDMINSWKNLNILEVGCGTGRFSIEISKRSGTITALDPALSMLEKIKKRANIKDGRFELVCGSGYELPFKDDSFDGCVCINVLSHLPNYGKVFREIHRVLRPNAFFIFNFPNLYSLLLPAGLLVNLRKKSLINPVYTKWYTLRRIKNDLQVAGFRIEMMKGVLLPAINPIPLQIVKKLNEISRDSTLKYISAGIFIKAVARKDL